MPSLPNIGGYGGSYQTIDLNVKNIDVVNCDADLVSTAVLVVNGNTWDIPAIEADIVAAEANITTLQGEMITANADISTLQGEMITANADISTLQGEMITANADISTLQGEMITANADISTLQGEMITANADISTLQGEMITANADISTLQGEMITANADISTLEGQYLDITNLQTKTQNITAVVGATTITGTVSLTGTGTITSTTSYQTTPAMLIIGKGVAQSITTATDTILTFPEFPYSLNQGSTGLTYSLGTFQNTSGATRNYHVDYVLSWPANSTNSREAWIATTATCIPTSQRLGYSANTGAGGGGITAQNGGACFQMAANATFTIVVRQNSGASLSITTAWITIHRL